MHAPRTAFVTAVTAGRRRLFQKPESAELLHEILQHYRAKGSFLLHAFVIMPEHVHLVLTPAPELVLDRVMQHVKGGFSFRLQSSLGVWERSFNEHRILDAHDFAEHIAYVENNPVQARLAIAAADYPHSSASRPGSVDRAPAHLLLREPVAS